MESRSQSFYLIWETISTKVCLRESTLPAALCSLAAVAPAVEPDDPAAAADPPPPPVPQLLLLPMAWLDAKKVCALRSLASLGVLPPPPPPPPPPPLVLMMLDASPVLRLRLSPPMPPVPPWLAAAETSHGDYQMMKR